MKFKSSLSLNVLVNLTCVLFFLWIVPNYGTEGLQNIHQYLNLDGTGVVFVFWSGLIASSLIFLSLLFEYKGISLKLDGSLLKKMLRYTLPLVLVGLCAVFNKEAGYLLLKYLKRLITTFSKDQRSTSAQS